MLVDQSAEDLGAGGRWSRDSSSEPAVRGLTILSGQSLVLLIGDNHLAAQRVADVLGITEVRAELLPQDKVRAVDEMDGKVLAMAHARMAMGHKGSALNGMRLLSKRAWMPKS